MKVVVQRVRNASVSVDGQITGQINQGLLILFGAQEGDQDEDTVWLVNKLKHLRIFNDADGKMNRSLLDIDGSVLVVSQFTLFGDCRKGRRPSFIQAAQPHEANRLYEKFCTEIRGAEIQCATGIFAADMKVTLTNDGPVTLILDTRDR